MGIYHGERNRPGLYLWNSLVDILNMERSKPAPFIGCSRTLLILFGTTAAHWIRRSLMRQSTEVGDLVDEPA